MTLRLAIIADDLTGALDAAAPFAGRGLSVQVALSSADLPEALAAGTDVVTVSTRSREVTEAEACAMVAEAVAALPPGLPVFKKIDSRMKGHIAAELALFPEGPTLVAPAIPDFDRRVEDGCVTGFGVETPIAIAPLLGRPASIPDIRSEADMRRAIDAAPDALLVGARGLAEALACRMTGRDAAMAPPLTGPRGTLVIGSRDPITLAQVAALDVPRVSAPNGVVPPLPPQDLLVIQATQGDHEATGLEVAANLAQGLRDHPAPDTLFLTGGATAEAILTGYGIRTMRLLGECLPGLPVAQAGGMIIVAKSGGFGTPDTLAQVVAKIRTGG
ncbi:hypothetical protein MU449_14710 [Falsirhodobacter halotolerans]|nr:hypothetical protein [Falsirhodobacter halotolerans]